MKSDTFYREHYVFSMKSEDNLQTKFTINSF